MRVIVAGSRSVEHLEEVARGIHLSGFHITEIVSGRARGVDLLGEQYADLFDIPVKAFPANWRDRDGVYNSRAGFQRNEQMAQYADALVAIWDGTSTGTADMIKRARRHKLLDYVHIVTRQ